MFVVHVRSFNPLGNGTAIPNAAGAGFIKKTISVLSAILGHLKVEPLVGMAQLSKYQEQLFMVALKVKNKKASTCPKAESLPRPKSHTQI